MRSGHERDRRGQAKGAKLSATELDKVKNMRFEGDQAARGRETQGIHDTLEQAKVLLSNRIQRLFT
jgi:hypothetical protein